VKTQKKGQHLKDVGVKEKMLKINIKEICTEGIDRIQVT
jgi:hypothetical protein